MDLREVKNQLDRWYLSNLFYSEENDLNYQEHSLPLPNGTNIGGGPGWGKRWQMSKWGF